VPILAFGRVVILSTINRHAARRPLRSLGSTGHRNRGASVGSVVNAQTVVVLNNNNGAGLSCVILTARSGPNLPSLHGALHSETVLMNS
jgi:hypothetical protein